jgi:hypothetical protein
VFLTGQYIVFLTDKITYGSKTPLNKFMLQTILKLYFNHVSLFYFFYRIIIFFGSLTNFTFVYAILQFCPDFYDPRPTSMITFDLYFNIILPISFIKQKKVQYTLFYFVHTFMIGSNHDCQQPWLAYNAISPNPCNAQGHTSLIISIV